MPNTAKKFDESAPAVYCGTYHKYNCGSIAGAWMNLEDYSDRDEFYAACAELHKNEDDPEFMFQDYQNFPESFYSESSVSDELYDWIALDDDKRELLEVYTDNIDQSGTLEQAEERYQGVYTSRADWAESYLDDTGAINEVPDHLKYYIDFDSYARDSDMSFIEVSMDKTWVFQNY